MEIVEPYAKMIDVADREAGVALLRKIEWCGRISHRSEGAQTETSWERFIDAVVIVHGDWSIVEHASVTVDAIVDRGITHEWVRHRIGAYTQESTRFVNYEKKMPPKFVMPPDLDGPQSALWTEFMNNCAWTYRGMLERGCTPQIARSVFPTGLSSRLVTTYNLRNWRHFFLMRTSREAHPQMRQVTIPLLAEFQQKIPILYDDIVPNARQSDNLKMMR